MKSGMKKSKTSKSIQSDQQEMEESDKASGHNLAFECNKTKENKRSVSVN